MTSYLLQSSICLFVFYIVYITIFKYSTNFQLNRAIVLFSVLFTAIFPLLPTNYLQLSGEPTINEYIAIHALDLENTTIISQQSKYSIDIYSIIYITGAIVFLLRFLISVVTLLFFYFRYPKYQRWGFCVVNVYRKMPPFTFFNTLFLSSEDLGKGINEELIVHEQAHRDQYHSVDVIIMEILTIIFWFHPTVWLFKKKLKTEHEFLADEKVLKKGFDVLKYQMLLLETCIGTSIHLTHSFANTSLKQRLKMMKMNKNNKKTSFIRAFTILTAAFVFIFVHAQLDAGQFSKPDKLPVYKEGDNEMYKTLSQNLIYPAQARKLGNQGTVFASFTINEKGKIEYISVGKPGTNLLAELVIVGYAQDGKPAPNGISPEMEKEAIRSINILGDFEPALKDGKPTSATLTLPIKFVLQ